MKILISNENRNAHYYIRMGHAKAFSACGHECVVWDLQSKSVFDAFDEFEPDIFWGQTYNLNNAIIKCIEERPHLRVILRAPDWSDLADKVKSKYPILTAQQDEIDLVNKLRDLTGKPNFLHCHYTQKSIEQTHKRWIDNDYNVVSMLNGADLFDFHNGSYNNIYESDICFIGGRWGYKAKNLDPYLVKLCHPKYDYNIKIFGNQNWGIPNYCGFINDEDAKHALSSSKICPNISEPHSNEYGYDIVERPFKLLSNKCFVISDHVQDLEDIIKGIVYVKSPEEFKEKIDYYLNNEEERSSIANLGYSEVMNNHTYFHRIANIFTNINLQHEADHVMRIYNEHFK